MGSKIGELPASREEFTRGQLTMHGKITRGNTIVMYIYTVYTCVCPSVHLSVTLCARDNVAELFVAQCSFLACLKGQFLYFEAQKMLQSRDPDKFIQHQSDQPKRPLNLIACFTMFCRFVRKSGSLRYRNNFNRQLSVRKVGKDFLITTE